MITTIGTWNVRTLNGVGTIQELTIKLDRYKIVYSGQDKFHQQGVAFIVRKELITSIYQLQDSF